MTKEAIWWTSPTQSIETGDIVMVSGRSDIEKFRNNPKFSIRVEISWVYNLEGKGMPDDDTAKIMEKVTDALNDVFDSDPVAVMTGVYTGDGQRDWIFYTLSTNIFQKKLNQALADLPLLPLEIYCENDPEWLEYQEMRSQSEINID